jgi:NAD(P)H dehydrogenase (quinone)
MLIIYAHPNRLGHCGHLLEQIEKRLKEKNKEYEVLDLYRMNFDPVLKNEEHYTSGGHFVTAENVEIQEKIKNNDRIIFIYPTWWNSAPAILKGFFERILVSGYAYKYINSIPRGLLTDKKAAVITTTGGNIILEKLFLGSRTLKIVVKDTLGFCGINAKGFMIGSSTKLTESQKNKIRKKAEKALKYLGI